MQYLQSFLFGFLFSVVGILPPGMLNMTSVKINHRNGRIAANAFIYGASIVIFIQAFLAILFAKFITKRTDINFILQEIGAIIFMLLTIYFFFLAKNKKAVNNSYRTYSNTNRFFYGILLSSLNLFPIPYYVAVSLVLASYNLFVFEKTTIVLFSLGVAIASILVFSFYIKIMNSKNTENSFIAKNINYFIGSVTLLVAIITILKLIKE